jgi:hypothetical protein
MLNASPPLEAFNLSFWSWATRIDEMQKSWYKWKWSGGAQGHASAYDPIPIKQTVFPQRGDTCERCGGGHVACRGRGGASHAAEPPVYSSDDGFDVVCAAGAYHGPVAHLTAGTSGSSGGALKRDVLPFPTLPQGTVISVQNVDANALLTITTGIGPYGPIWLITQDAPGLTSI